MTRPIDLIIQNKLSEISVVRDKLDQLVAELRVPAEAMMPLQVALDEIVSNVVKYSWPDGGAHELLVRITVNANGISLDIFDDGRPFDPCQAPEPDARPAGERPTPGGVGIQMVKKLVDGLTYERAHGRNHTRMTKNYAVGLKEE